MTWTPERVNTLISLFHRGLSRGAIALQLGVTRNAVIGKINRLNNAGKLGEQPARKSFRKAARKPGRKPSRKPRKRSASSTVSAGSVVSPAGPAAKQQVPSAPPCEDSAVALPSIACDAAASHLVAVEGLSVSLIKAETDQCRFPIWSHTALPSHPDYGQVCGAKVKPSKPGQPLGRYCVHHHRVMAGDRAETSKATRIVRATVRQARAQGVA